MSTMYQLKFAFLILNLLFTVHCLNDGKPSLLEIPVNKNLKESDEVRLSCDIKMGRSPIAFEWLINDRKIQPSNNVVIKNREDESRLIIKSLSIDHLGDVTCVASNELGSDSRTVKLFFNAKPKWTHDEPVDMKVALGSQVSIVCNQTGSPKPTVYWSLVDSAGSTIEKFDTNMLTLLKLSKQNVGKYKCTGRNALGSLEKIIAISYYATCFVANTCEISRIFSWGRSTNHQKINSKTKGTILISLSLIVLFFRHSFLVTLSAEPLAKLRFVLT